MKRLTTVAVFVLMLMVVLTSCSQPQQAAAGPSGPINPSLSITSAELIAGVPSVALDEGDVGRTSMNFVLELQNPNDRSVLIPALNDIIVTYSTQDNNAVATVDYDEANGTLIIPTGAVTGVIKVQIIGDTVLESDESFRLTILAKLDDADQTILVNNVVISGVIVNDDNNPPVAVADTLSVLVDSGLTSKNVIANDTDKGDILTLTAVSTSGSGSVAINANKVSINYTPGLGFFGTEVVTYTVSDNHGGSDPTGQLTVTVIRPEMSLHPAHASEGDSGSLPLVFTVTTNSPLASAVTADYTVSDGTATIANNDYVAVVANGKVTVPAGERKGSFQVSVNGDLNLESAENINVVLSAPSSGIVLQVTSATGWITNGLNDTGLSGSACANDTTIGLTCPQNTYPGQDAELGRDAGLTAEAQSKIGGGSASFDFTKMDAAGTALANQAVTYAAAPWDCVRDNVTGLWWEVKTLDATVRDKGQLFSWYNTQASTNGGFSGSNHGGACVDVSRCDTEKYTADINSVGLCGFTDWRLPTRAELNSLLDYSVPSPGPTVDLGFFPNTLRGSYWTATPSVFDSLDAWTIIFFNSRENLSRKNQQSGIRLVHGRGE